MKSRLFTLPLKFALLPLLTIIYPIVFLYNNNAAIMDISSLFNTLIFYIPIGVAVYLTLLLANKINPEKSAVASSIFLVFFNIYGIIYNWLFQLNKVQVEHYTLFPLIVLISLYAAWGIAQVNSTYLRSFWNGSVLILFVLIAFNIVNIISIEIEKGEMLQPSGTKMVEAVSNVNKNHPDIYYIVFDEFAGFDAMRNYWQYDQIDQFVGFLKEKGFFIAEKSRASSIDTLHQMSTRLNYKTYDLSGKNRQTYFTDIADSRATRYLKSLGYTIVVFDETRSSFAYPAKPSIIADYSFEHDSELLTMSGRQFDDFGILVANNTMLRIFSRLYELRNPVLEQHEKMIYFTMNKLENMHEVSTPKFVYVHLMLPHMPFMFDENGNYVDPAFHSNWDYYLGNYIFSTRVAEKIVNGILSSADPERLPVIVLQSDHGARNKVTANPNSAGLENYPEEYKKDIMFAMYIPGYDFSSIPQQVDPINTFPIIFNYLFDAGIPLH